VEVPVRHLIFDTETTDLSTGTLVPDERQPRLTEFAGAMWDDASGDVQEHVWLFNPGVPITPKAAEISHITNEMVKDAPPFHKHAPAIRALLVLADVVVAHNLVFDKNMLACEFRRNNTADVKWPRGICTVEATEHLMGRRMKLSELYRLLFAEDLHGAHRAIVDVRALLRCYRELIKRGEL
jgi:DNA polymerase III subunit epsilon